MCSVENADDVESERGGELKAGQDQDLFGQFAVLDQEIALAIG